MELDRRVQLDLAPEREERYGTNSGVLLLALVFAGLGFAVHVLWIIAVILFVCWVVGFARSRGHARSA